MLAHETAPLNAALERLKAAYAHLTDRTTRLKQANERLLTTKLDCASIDKRVADFASAGDSDLSQASKLVAQQAQAHAVEALLEKTIDTLTEGLTEAQADVLIAERDVAAAQLVLHEKQLGDMVANFLREHRAELAEMTAQARITERFRGGYGVHAVPSVFNTLAHITHAAEQSLDDAWHASIKIKETAATTVHKSAAIDAQTRGKVGIGAMNGRDWLIRILTPEPPKAPEPFNVAYAVECARDAARRSEHLRIRIEDEERRLRTHPGDQNIKDKIAELMAEADRCDEIVATWDAKITEHRAQQEAQP